MTIEEFRRRQAFEMSEKELSQQICDLAQSYGWLVARFPTWRPTGTTEGYPDLTMVRTGRLIFAELKRQAHDPQTPAQAKRENPTFSQRTWLQALGQVEHIAALLGKGPIEVYVWRPSDLLSGRILEELRL